MELKYFTIKSYESIDIFLRRVKFSVPSLNDYAIQYISDLMGKGIRVVTLVNNFINTNIKLEIDNYQLDELKKYFKPLKINSKPLKSGIRTDGLGNIEELYK